MTLPRLTFTRDFKLAAECPSRWHAERIARVFAPAPKECHATGNLFHAVVLTPERVQAVYDEYGDLLVLSRASGGYAKGDPNGAARATIANALYCRGIPAVAELLDGARCETEILWELAGVLWACHMDLITASGCIMDIKTCRDIRAEEWIPERKMRVPWHEAMLYWWQLAVYRKAVGPSNVPAVGIIACQATEDVPEVRVIELAADCDGILDEYAATVERSMGFDWISPVTGMELPPFPEMAEMSADSLPRCEACAWCRKSRTAYNMVHRIARERGL
jgi:hypothetical protein